MRFASHHSRAALRCIDRAIERIQHPNERPSAATLQHWASTVNAESWRFVGADFRFMPTRAVDFIALADASMMSCLLDNVEHASNAEIALQSEIAQKRGDMISMKHLDWIREARHDPKAKRDMRERMLGVVREIDGRILLLFALRQYKATVLDSIRAAKQDEAPFLALLSSFVRGAANRGRHRMTCDRTSQIRRSDGSRATRAASAIDTSL